LTLIFLKESRFLDEKKEQTEIINEKTGEIELNENKETESDVQIVENVENFKGIEINSEIKNEEIILKEENEQLNDYPIAIDDEKEKNEKTENESVELLLNVEEKINTEEINESKESKSIFQRLRDGFWYVLSSDLLKKEPIISTIMYALLGMHQIVFDEILPIWMWTPVENSGLGLQTFKIGIIQGIVGVFLLIFQIFFIPWFINKFSIKRSNQISVLLALPVIFTFVEVFRIPKFPNMEWLVWTLIIIQLIWKQVWSSIAFTTVILMVNNSVPKESLGTLNGISQSSVAFTRAIGPSIATPLFALSISGLLWFPLDVHLCFYLSAFVITLLLPLSFILPKKFSGN
jgi:hypothetical protein